MPNPVCIAPSILFAAFRGGPAACAGNIAALRGG